MRFQTGNLPSGVVVSKDGKRAYANNEANFSVTAMNLETNTVHRPATSPRASPRRRARFEHAILVGKLAFFTALGIPDNGIFDTPIRDFNPLNFRGKQSKDAWSSCGSCHPDGLADGVTWFFGTGPRQTKPLDGMFSKGTNLRPGSSSTGAPSAAATPTSTPTPAPPRAAAASPAMIRFDPGQCFASANRPRPSANPPSTTTASPRGAATPSTRRPCGSLPPCGR